MVMVGVGSVSSESSIHCLVVLGISTSLRERQGAFLYFPLPFAPPSVRPSLSLLPPLSLLYGSAYPPTASQLHLSILTSRTTARPMFPCRAARTALLCSLSSCLSARLSSWRTISTMTRHVRSSCNHLTLMARLSSLAKCLAISLVKHNQETAHGPGVLWVETVTEFVFSLYNQQGD